MKGHTDSILSVKFSKSDKNILFSCSNDKTVKLWDIRTAKCLKSDKTKGCKNLETNHDSSMFAFSSKEDDSITFYDTNKFQIKKTIEFKTKIGEFEFDSNDLVTLVTSSSGSIYVMNSKTLDNEPMAIIDAHFPAVNTLNINKSNTKFATGAADAIISLWDLNELIQYKVIKKSELPIRKIMFSHDSKFLGSIYEGNNLDIFDVESGECIHSILTENTQYSLAWNPREYILAYCGDDKNRNSSDEGKINLLNLNNI